MDVQGFAAHGFGPVRDCFAAVLGAQPGTGAAFAAWFDGEPVVDLWGGHADAARRRPWQAGSLVMPYSVSKPFAAVCALRLAEAGRLDLDAPVQRYWPGFRAPATVRHVLSHQTGVVLLDRPAPTAALYDWDLLCGLLAAQQPAWPPGTAHGESALFYGHLRAVANPPGAHDAAVVNGARWRAAEIPAVNGHGTARAVAGFYHALSSGRLLRPAMLAEAVTPQATGPDRVFGGDTSWGLGFGVDAAGWGMGGLGGSYGGACPAGGYTVGFVTGSAGGHDRGEAVENALRDCLRLPPLSL